MARSSGGVRLRMACPFFMPLERFGGGAWAHPSRLPLGDGWRGHCTAPPDTHQPSDHEMQTWCNLGYAVACPHLPADRTADAVRFSVARDSGTELSLRYVCEASHRPVAHGLLDYRKAEQSWSRAHPDARIQAMAQCYLESYLRRALSAGPAIASERP